MTQREYDVESAKASVKCGEIKLRDTRHELETGSRKAKAEYEAAIQKLRSEVERASTDLERHKAWLAACETKISEPFKGNED